MSNIYLNEFDRFMTHDIKRLAYLRYGDDWLCFVPTQAAAQKVFSEAILKLDELALQVNPKVHRIVPAWKGIPYLGVTIWPDGHYLQTSVRKRALENLSEENAASYRSLFMANDKQKRLKELDWVLSHLV